MKLDVNKKVVSEVDAGDKEVMRPNTLPGWKCVQVDFSQLEIFVLAWLSGDVLLTEHLKDTLEKHLKKYV